MHILQSTFCCRRLMCIAYPSSLLQSLTSRHSHKVAERCCFKHQRQVTAMPAVAFSAWAPSTFGRQHADVASSSALSRSCTSSLSCRHMCRHVHHTSAHRISSSFVSSTITSASAFLPRSTSTAYVSASGTFTSLCTAHYASRQKPLGSASCRAEAGTNTSNSEVGSISTIPRSAVDVSVSTLQSESTAHDTTLTSTLLQPTINEDGQSAAVTTTSISSVIQVYKTPKKVWVLPSIITAPAPGQNLDLAAFDNGMLLVDKPLNWTSFDVCGKLRNTMKFMGVKKVGHAGTLDPLATGLLIVVTGKGTHFADEFQAMDKVYSGTIRLGEWTPSYDAETEVTRREPWEHITDVALQEAAASFTGNIQQVPPMFSAIKIKGKRLYELARDGRTLDRPARDISITKFQVSRPAGPTSQDVHFVAACSKGTYIRSLAHDFGEKLGTVAYLSSLRREAIGRYQLDASQSWKVADLLQALVTAREDRQAAYIANQAEEAAAPSGTAHMNIS